MKINYFTSFVKEKLDTLSHKLKFYASNNNSTLNYADLNIKAENLKYNLSYLLAKIILKLDIPTPSIPVFEKIIHNYNQKNNLKLSLDDYLNIGWIRIINDKVVLPEVVRHFVSEIRYNESKDKTISFPQDKEHHLRCLKEFYTQYNSDTLASITKKELLFILQDFNVDIQFLEEREIIVQDSDINNVYNWKAYKYMRYLRNEVLSTIWLLAYNQKQDISTFKHFINLTELSDFHSNKLNDFLPFDYMNKLSDYSIELLNNAKDLDNSKIEFNKVWLDAPSYTHINLTDKIPEIEIKGDSPLNLYLEERYLRRLFPSIFDIQSTRNIYASLLCFIACNQNKQSYPFENYLSQLQKINKPYIIETIYRQIMGQFPQAIPYLLLDTNYIPIAFRLINEIEFNTNVISLDASYEKKIEASSKKRTEFWLDSFKIILKLKPQNQDRISGETVFHILYNLVEQVFSFNQNNRTAIVTHNNYKKCYDEALKLLSESEIETRVYSYNTGLHSKPKLFPSIITELVHSALNKSVFLPLNEYVSFDMALVDLLIELLKLSQSYLEQFELTPKLKKDLENSIHKITTFLANKIQKHYKITEIEVWAFHNKETRKVKHRHDQFGYEIIDWGELYLQFSKENLIISIDDNFKESLIFDTKREAGVYTDLNHEQEEKIKLYVKSLLLAYISINTHKKLYQNNLVQSTLIQLEKLIFYYVKAYSNDNIKKKQINIFDNRYTYLYQDIYYKKLTPLLFHALNYFKHVPQNQVLDNYFFQLEDINGMLSAINILTDTEHKEYISKLLEQIDIDDFASNASINTLEQVLIEAVNSENYWNFAEPLLEKVEERFTRTKLNNDDTQYFLFRIKLLLAFKQKNWTVLNEIEVPQYQYRVSDDKKEGHEYKQFYIALYKIYHNQDFITATKLLQSLLSSNSKNIEYRFYLYYVQTQEAYSKNKTNLPQIKLEWDKFLYDENGNLEKFSPEQLKKLSKLNEVINSLNVIHYSYLKDYTRFDQSINKLDNNLLYEEIIGECIYQAYIDRQMYEAADDYISKAVRYYENQNKEIPSKIKKLFQKPKSLFLLQKYKTALVNIRSLPPKDLVSIIPSVLNNKRELNTFILNELIEALKIVLDKIKSVEQITFEDRYNDLLLAILRFRFPIWGWTILDQPRIGVSQKKIKAGELDHLLQVAGQNITLFEAFLLKGKDTTKTTEHILKIEDYISYINQYYIIVYYKGEPQNFPNTWKSYKDIVKTINYPESLNIDKKTGFIDLKAEFSNVRGFEISKTFHGDNNEIELYHVMVNFSTKT